MGYMIAPVFVFPRWQEEHRELLKMLAAAWQKTALPGEEKKAASRPSKLSLTDSQNALKNGERKLIPFHSLPMEEKKDIINKDSSVSKAYLYTNQEIRQRIENLREQQEGLPSARQVKREMTDASKDAVMAAKNKKINELEAENKRLKEER